VPAKSDRFADMEASLKRAASALRDAGVPFLLGGTLACWARGGTEAVKDIDLLVKPADAERALDVLADAGMETDRPPEEWLYKAWDGEVLIDLMFAPSGLPVNDDLWSRSELLDVVAVSMPVMALEDVMVTKLLSLGEHHLDYEGVLQIARSLREQIAWDDVRRRTGQSPYAKAFFTLLDELGLAQPDARESPVRSQLAVARAHGEAGEGRR